VTGCPRVYSSVTTFNHLHFAEFDADLILRKMNLKKPGGKYFGLSPEEIKAGWDKNRDEAARLGTALHANIEDYYNRDRDLAIDRENQQAFAYFQNFHAYFQKTQPQMRPYRTEWTIYDETVLIAGTIDMVFENTLDGTLSIYDWKRCKELKKVPAFGQFAITECISHLPDTNFWHYALQLNMYKAILEAQYGKQVQDLCLVLLHPSQANFQIVRVPDLHKEVQDLFALRKAKDLNGN
jgi:hypothetical protein